MKCYYYNYLLLFSAKAKEYVFTVVGLCVCLSVYLSVTTITKKIVDDLYQILWEGF